MSAPNGVKDQCWCGSIINYKLKVVIAIGKPVELEKRVFRRPYQYSAPLEVLLFPLSSPNTVSVYFPFFVSLVTICLFLKYYISIMQMQARLFFQ